MREGMNRQDYINAILEQIDSKQMQEEIEKELSGHIDDREEYYREMGYDSEAAAEMALERMGSPEAAADGFNKVHKKYRLALAILAVIMSGIVVLFFWILAIGTEIEKRIGIGITEALILMYIIGLSVLGKRRNNRFICFTAVIDFFLAYGFYFIYKINYGSIDELCSRIVLKLTSLLTLDFDCLSAFGQVGRITVAPYLTYLSAAFYTAIFIILILVFISVCMLKKPTYSLRKKHFARKVFKTQKTTWIFLALTMLILPFGPFDKNEGMTVKTNEYFNSVIIAQSDTPCPISEISPEDILTIRSGCDWSKSPSNDDWSYYIFYLERTSNHHNPQNITCTNESDNMIGGHLVEKEIGNKLKYEIMKFDIPCSVTKDYVYIEFLNSDSNEFYDDNAYKLVSNSPENWYEVESVGEISAAIDAYNQVEITVSKKSP